MQSNSKIWALRSHVHKICEIVMKCRNSKWYAILRVRRLKRLVRVLVSRFLWNKLQWHTQMHINAVWVWQKFWRNHTHAKAYKSALHAHTCSHTAIHIHTHLGWLSGRNQSKYSYTFLCHTIYGEAEYRTNQYMHNNGRRIACWRA